MKQDIIPYSQLRHRRVRSERPIAGRLFSVISVPDVSIPVIEVDTYVWEPAPMTRPIEALSSEEKVRVLEQALFRAQSALKNERRRGFRRHVLN